MSWVLVRRTPAVYERTTGRVTLTAQRGGWEAVDANGRRLGSDNAETALHAMEDADEWAHAQGLPVRRVDA